MKLYKISGSREYVDWDVLHNQQGYSTSATNPVTWKSSLGNTWGETVADGYMEPTAASGWATKALTSVDLPALQRPKMAICMRSAFALLCIAVPLRI